MTFSRRVRETLASTIGLLAGLYYLMSYFGQMVVFTSLWEHDMKYAAYLIAIGIGLNLVAPSKRWPGVFVSLPLASATIFLSLGDITHSVWQELPYLLFAALCFSLSGLLAYLLTASLLKAYGMLFLQP